MTTYDWFIFFTPFILIIVYCFLEISRLNRLEKINKIELLSSDEIKQKLKELESK